MDNFVAAVLIALVLLSIFYQPIRRDLHHAKTGEKPEPTWLDHASEAVIDWIDRTASRIFSLYEKMTQKQK